MYHNETLRIACSLLLAATLIGCGGSNSDGNENSNNGGLEVEKNTEWKNEQEIEIIGYSGNAQEPQVYNNEQFLFFNNKGGSDGQADIHYATKITDTKYQYQGILPGVNDPTELDGTASLDAVGNFYFVSIRDYGNSQDTVYGGVFNTAGSVGGVARIGQNITDTGLGLVTMGIDISMDGTFMFLSRAHFTNFANPPDTADLDLAFKSAGVFNRVPKATVDKLFKNINTTQYLEYATALSNDGLELYFTRGYDMTKPDSLKIMVSKRNTVDDDFGMPKEIAAIQGTVTEAPCLSTNERYLYYHKIVSGRTRVFRVGR